MEDKAQILSDRLLNYAVFVVQVVNKLGKTYAGKYIAGQLLRFNIYNLQFTIPLC
jgi:hypothetical protein